MEKEIKNNKEHTNRHEQDTHRGIKNNKKQRNLNIEELYKNENNHYHAYES
jgi:hypothetical protein